MESSNNRLVKLLQGDNMESFKKLPDNSIDSVVTDGPYGLSFMNKKWDYDVPSVDFWKEVYRVLKPGGHVLSFGGTRTYHRMVVNIEDAGFEIRDQIMWLYGCLDDKSEILTDSGWKKYTEINLNDKALSWNNELNVLEFNKIDDIIIKPYKGDMVLLKNKHTEQILTPNHRVYHKYERKERGYLGENWEVVEAGDMKKSGRYTLPLASYYEGEGIGGEDYAALLGWIWSEGEFDKKGNAIRISQSSINQPLVDEIKELIERLNIKYSHYSRERFYNYKNKGLQSYIDNSFYFSTENDINDKIRTDLTNKKLNFDFVKKMTIREKIAFLDAAHKGDGSKGRETIYQNDLSQLELLQFMLFTIGKSSYFDLNKMAINFRNKETTELQHKNLNKKVHYEGDVWCVRVKNSAFVARRGDKVFITGNSGFPKSHNIGKAVDKIEGNEREVVGEKKAEVFDNPILKKQGSMMGSPEGRISGDIKITKGQSEYEGWGTALKPANEPICVARKPLSEKSVALNVLKWGTGGINIDGCRVGSDSIMINKLNSDKNLHHNYTGDGGKWEGKQELNEGRFPANIILECICDEVIKGEKDEVKKVTRDRTVEAGGGVGDKKVKTGITAIDNYNDKGDIHTNPMCPCRLMDEQNSGASRFFYQAKVSKKERNMGLDGFEEKKKWLKGGGGSGISERENVVAKNTHPTLKPVQLMSYLCRMITPPGGTILDPFMGSGSTGIAAMLEGFNFIGMDLDPDYVKIAEARISNYEKYREFLKK
jgi:DNA modification methylase